MRLTFHLTNPGVFKTKCHQVLVRGPICLEEASGKNHGSISYFFFYGNVCRKGGENAIGLLKALCDHGEEWNPFASQCTAKINSNKKHFKNNQHFFFSSSSLEDINLQAHEFGKDRGITPIHASSTDTKKGKM